MRLESQNPRHTNMALLRNCAELVVLAVLCVAPVRAQLSVQDVVKLGGIMQRCQQETGASNEDIQSILGRKVPETRSGKCMLACAGEALGMMRGGSLNTQGTLALADHLMQGRDQKLQDTVKNAILTCAKNSDTRRAPQELIPYQLFKPSLKSVEEVFLSPPPEHAMKTLHSKSSNFFSEGNHRVRRQSEHQDNTLRNPSQPIPYAPGPPQTQTYPNQYPNQQGPDQQYPLQNNQNNPIAQPLAQLGRLLDSITPASTYPYTQPYQQPYVQPYVQPVVVATPYAGIGVPVVPFRGKRSPQKLSPTSTEITLPPEVAAIISERLRELLFALISAEEGLNFDSTEVTEKDAEVVESNTRPPRKRRQAQQDDSPLTTLIDKVVRNGPFHHIAQDLRKLMPDSMTSTDGPTTANTPAPAEKA